jgi:F-type H+-transporting ATPase subunit b
MDLILPDPGTLVWTAVTFLILFSALAFFAWPRILAALREREEGIAADIKKAEETRVKAEERLTELEGRLDKAKQEANAIIDEGKADAEKLKQEYLSEQRKEGDAIRARVSREIALAKDKAVEEIRERTVELAFELARRVMEKSLDKAQHAELVEKFIDDFDKQQE